jgi:hypothetical protein
MKLFKIKNQIVRVTVAYGVALGLASCSQPESASGVAVQLPISINEVMASLINHSADPIWIAAWRSPQSEEDWRELEHLAHQLQMGGALLTIPGTGPADEKWTSNSEWRGYANQLSAAAGEAVAAARARNVQQISSAGDDIVAVCESCHIEFKPDVPTMNIYGELSPTAEDFN